MAPKGENVHREPKLTLSVSEDHQTIPIFAAKQQEQSMPFHDISMCERFRNAKETLIKGPGSLQERLETVFATQLVCISPDEFPEDLRELAWSVSFYVTRKEA